MKKAKELKLEIEAFENMKKKDCLSKEGLKLLEQKKQQFKRLKK